MRRLFSIFALLVLSACYGTRPPVYVDPSSLGPSIASRSSRGTPACHVIARSRCASETCRGSNMDYVTLACAGGQKINRCVANLGCSTS